MKFRLHPTETSAEFLRLQNSRAAIGRFHMSPLTSSVSLEIYNPDLVTLEICPTYLEK